MRNAVTPSLLPIRAVMKFLGLEETYSYSATSIELLLRQLNEERVPIFLLGSPIYGVRQELVNEECNVDAETGRIYQSDRLNSERFISELPAIEITQGSFLHIDSENPQLKVTEFKLEESHFMTTDDSGMLEELVYPLSSFYIRQDDIAKLKKKHESRETISEKGRSTNFSMQERRELALKFWLSSKATEKIQPKKPFDLDLEQCYRTINNPTQEVVWAALQQIDKKLFAQGKDDFFKQQKLIKFKLGTGAKR